MEIQTHRALKFFCAPVDQKIVELRHTILTPEHPKSSATVDADHKLSTLHFVAYTEQRPLSPISCVTYYLSNWEGVTAYQLRWMATETAFQRQGIGKKLMQFAEEIIMKDKRICKFWCNARKESVGFYESQGWTCFGEEFIIPGVGPHIKMTKGIAPF